MHEGMLEFLESVTPLGETSQEFLLYALRARKAAPVHVPNLSAWPKGTDAAVYLLANDPWPVVVELFEIRSPAPPDDIERALFSALLDLMYQGATLGWYMFDAAFGGIRPLFTPWTIEQTYGVCIPWRVIGLALTRAQRQSPSWADLLAEATEHVNRTHAQIEHLPPVENTEQGLLPQTASD